MNYGIQRLAHLVQVKNDLNRKRRRFYAMSYISWTKKKAHKSFPVKFAKDMYEKTKLEMKAMTAEMRACRKEINATLNWTDHGAIGSIECGDHRFSIKEIARLAELYKADAILLGD